MTTVILSDYSVSARGHAGYAEHGQDIVCAAMSILVQTFAECLLQEEAEGTVSHVEIKLDPGNASLRWKGSSLAFPTIETGLRLLAESYPEYVEMQEERANRATERAAGD